MRIKFLSIMMAVAVALAFTSCDNKGNSSASDNSDSTSSKSESVSSASTSDEGDSSEESVGKESQEDAFGAINEPTGDLEKDVKQCGEEFITLMKTEVNSVDDAKKLMKDQEALFKKYENFYKEKGDVDFKKFEEEFTNLMNSSNRERYIEALNNNEGIHKYGEGIFWEEEHAEKKQSD